MTLVATVLAGLPWSSTGLASSGRPTDDMRTSDPTHAGRTNRGIQPTFLSTTIFQAAAKKKANSNECRNDRQLARAHVANGPST
jgi:hypothetical protein